MAQQDWTDMSLTAEIEVISDLTRIAIPRDEIIEAMARVGEDEALNRVCIAVATVFDAVETARALARD